MTNPEKNDIPAQTAGSEADNPALLLPDESLDQLAGGADSPDDREQRRLEIIKRLEELRSESKDAGLAEIPGLSKELKDLSKELNDL